MQEEYSARKTRLAKICYNHDFLLSLQKFFFLPIAHREIIGGFCALHSFPLLLHAVHSAVGVLLLLLL